jgi:hypothetical protein
VAKTYISFCITGAMVTNYLQIGWSDNKIVAKNIYLQETFEMSLTLSDLKKQSERTLLSNVSLHQK